MSNKDQAKQTGWLSQIVAIIITGIYSFSHLSLAAVASFVSGVANGLRNATGWLIASATQGFSNVYGFLKGVGAVIIDKTQEYTRKFFSLLEEGLNISRKGFAKIAALAGFVVHPIWNYLASPSLSFLYSLSAGIFSLVFTTSRNLVGYALATITDFIGSVFALVSALGVGIGVTLRLVIGLGVSFINTLRNLIQNTIVKYLLTPFISGVITVISQTLKTLSFVLVDFVQIIRVGLAAVIAGISSFLKLISINLRLVFALAVASIVYVLNGLRTLVALGMALIIALFHGLYQLGTFFLSIIINLLTSALHFVAAIVGELMIFSQKILASMLGLTSFIGALILNWVISPLAGIINAILHIVTNLARYALSLLKDLIQTVRVVISAGLTAIVLGLSLVASVSSEIGLAIVKAFVLPLGFILSVLYGVFGSGWEGFKRFLSSTWEMSFLPKFGERFSKLSPSRQQAEMVFKSLASDDYVPKSLVTTHQQMNFNIIDAVRNAYHALRTEKTSFEIASSVYQATKSDQDFGTVTTEMFNAISGDFNAIANSYMALNLSASLQITKDGFELIKGTTFNSQLFHEVFQFLNGHADNPQDPCGDLFKSCGRTSIKSSFNQIFKPLSNVDDLEFWTASLSWNTFSQTMAANVSEACEFVSDEQSATDTFKNTFKWVGGTDYPWTLAISAFQGIGAINDEISSNISDAIAGKASMPTQIKAVYETLNPLGLSNLYHFMAIMASASETFASIDSSLNGNIDIGHYWNQLPQPNSVAEIFVESFNTWGNQFATELFTKINYSSFFGNERYAQQNVVLSVFDKLIGNQSVKSFIDDNYQAILRGVERFFSCTKGKIQGLLCFVPVLLSYIVVGTGYGFKNSGIPGAIRGFFYALYQTLTFIPRNIQRHDNLVNEPGNENSTLWNMYLKDISHLKASEFVAWYVLKDSHTNAYDAFSDGNVQNSSSKQDQNRDSTSSFMDRLGSNPALAASVGQNPIPGYQPPLAENNSSVVQPAHEIKKSA